MAKIKYTKRKVNSKEDKIITSNKTSDSTSRSKITKSGHRKKKTSLAAIQKNYTKVKNHIKQDVEQSSEDSPSESESETTQSDCSSVPIPAVDVTQKQLSKTGNKKSKTKKHSQLSERLSECSSLSTVQEEHISSKSNYKRNSGQEHASYRTKKRRMTSAATSIKDQDATNKKSKKHSQLSERLSECSSLSTVQEVQSSSKRSSHQKHTSYRTNKKRVSSAATSTQDQDVTSLSKDPSRVSNASRSEKLQSTSHVSDLSHSQTEQDSHSKSNLYKFNTHYDSSDDLGNSNQIEMKKCLLTGKRLPSCKTLENRTREFTDSLIDLGVGFVLNKYSKRRHYKNVEDVMRHVQAKLQRNIDVLKAPESDVAEYDKLQDEFLTVKEEWERLHKIETRLTKAVEEEEERVMEEDTTSQDDNLTERPRLMNTVNPLLSEKYEEELCLPQFH